MDVLDFIGKDIISRLSSRYPDIKFYLIDTVYLPMWNRRKVANFFLRLLESKINKLMV